jgi:hypothetical protein
MFGDQLTLATTVSFDTPFNNNTREHEDFHFATPDPLGQVTEKDVPLKETDVLPMASPIPLLTGPLSDLFPMDVKPDGTWGGTGHSTWGGTWDGTWDDTWDPFLMDSQSLYDVCSPLSSTQIQSTMAPINLMSTTSADLSTGSTGLQPEIT